MYYFCQENLCVVFSSRHLRRWDNNICIVKDVLEDCKAKRIAHTLTKDQKLFIPLVGNLFLNNFLSLGFPLLLFCLFASFPLGCSCMSPALSSVVGYGSGMGWAAGTYFIGCVTAAFFFSFPLRFAFLPLSSLIFLIDKEEKEILLILLKFKLRS